MATATTKRFMVPSISDETAEPITGSPGVLLLGICSAWMLFVLYLIYAAAVVASGAAQGLFNDPYWAIAEILILVGAPLQVTLFAAVHECAPLRAKMLSLTALGWMLVMAAFTVTVHFVNLTVARRIDIANPALARVFAFEWPSLLVAVELVAWHLFFGLALLFAASVFTGRGRTAAVRLALRVGGTLCLLGLIGPAVGNMYWRLIGVLGYGIVFPVACVMIGLVFKDARNRSMVPPAVGSSSDG